MKNVTCLETPWADSVLYIRTQHNWGRQNINISHPTNHLIQTYFHVAEGQVLRKSDTFSKIWVCFVDWRPGGIWNYYGDDWQPSLRLWIISNMFPRTLWDFVCSKSVRDVKTQWHCLLTSDGQLSWRMEAASTPLTSFCLTGERWKHEQIPPNKNWKTLQVTANQSSVSMLDFLW